MNNWNANQYTHNLNKYITSEEVGSTAVTKSSVLSALSTYDSSRKIIDYKGYIVLEYAYDNHTWIIKM